MESIKAEDGNIDAVVSCLASRSGIKKDAYAIDYQASKNCLDSGIAAGARHYVLLSAFCCKNPWLQFQQAKLKFEADLANQDSMTHTIVRPTAFFKSVSGQLEVVQQGAPFVMFGDGKVTRCNPISEADLATYLVDSILDESRLNKNIDLGGPDEPLTMLKQGEVSSACLFVFCDVFCSVLLCSPERGEQRYLLRIWSHDSAVLLSFFLSPRYLPDAL
jgi:divinyl chlorophyllide a 8-vinyl-reductase